VAGMPGAARDEERGRSLARRFRAVRDRTRALAARLTAEDAMVQSMPDASPAKWHLAHTTWFFEAFLLARRERDFRAFHPRFAYLFNSYYDAVGPRQPRPQRGVLSRPPLDEVLRYRDEVEARVEALLAGLDAAGLDLLELGVAHEEQHQELLLTDVKHAFWSNPLRPAYDPDAAPPSGAPAPPHAFLPCEGGLAAIGAGGEGFAFDCERPRHRIWLEPHALGSRLVTAGEWREFVQDGGYRRAELWLSEGWAAAQRSGWEAPLYWERDGDGWSVFTLGGPRPLDPAAPVVHVSLYEADAYARWAGARLPTEAELERAAEGAAADGALLEDGRLHPAPAREGPGLRQLVGDAWEWTRSAYAPHPGFRPLDGALGEYNGKFMVGQLVLRGGSCATPGAHLRPSYRNFFPPDARWQFTGVRLARDAG